MSPFGTRSRADELARLLDGGGAAALSPAMSVPSVVLAARLRSAGQSLAPVIAPRAEFRAALRTRLLAVAAVQSVAPAATPARSATREAAASWASARRGGRTAGVAAGALASVVAAAGVAVAGSQSLPGDPFYGVKRTTEALQLRTADGDLARGNRHLDFAATRLREVRALALGRDALSSSALPAASSGAGGTVLTSTSTQVAAGAALGPAVAERVRQTLADMDSETREGTQLLTAAYRESRASAPLQTIARFATRQSEGLAELLPALPQASQDRARVSLALLTGVADDAGELLGLGTCGPACDPTTSAPAPGTSVPGAPADPTGATPPCSCEPLPAPGPQVSSEPVAPSSEQPSSGSSSASPEPTPSQTSAPADPGSPSPQPSSTSGTLPVPVPSLPVPVPTLPVEIPAPLTTSLPTSVPLVGPVLPLLVPDAGLLSAPAPVPTPAPLAPVDGVPSA